MLLTWSNRGSRRLLPGPLELFVAAENSEMRASSSATLTAGAGTFAGAMGLMGMKACKCVPFEPTYATLTSAEGETLYSATRSLCCEYGLGSEPFIVVMVPKFVSVPNEPTCDCDDVINGAVPATRLSNVLVPL